jgi:RNA polymerase sigma factor (sigma-70 family)
MAIDKEDFLSSNIGLIKKFANKYHFDTPKFSFEDLVQIGNKAAIKALDSYDNTRGIKATTYVGKAIDRDICEFVRSNKHDVYISNHAQRKHYKECQESGETKSFGPNELVAVRLDWDWENASADDNKSFADVLPSGAPPPEEQMMVDEQRDILLEEIERLPQDQQTVIMGKYFDSATFVDLGKDLGVSKQRAQQIEQKAFVTLKTRLGSRLGNFIARSDGLARRG